ncbi:MAG: 6,7-dimethyl-8-ribityllumazine synthase [Bdellovibrionota bacterium]
MTIEASKTLLENAKSDFASWQQEITLIKNITVIYTSWYPEVIDSLCSSARDFFSVLEVPSEKIDFVKVSGSWELPLVAKAYLAANKKPDMILALGCVVKGATPHFDILCQAVARQLMELQVNEKTPIGFGVLTVNNLEQALARKDKGAEAAEAALRSWVQLKGIR